MSALAQVLPQVFPYLKDKVFDYAASKDFRKLWQFAALPPDRIVIVWTQTAPDPALAPINAADCLSPIDWAAAYVKQLKQLAIAPANWPEILVLDAAPEAHVNVPTLAHFHTLRPDQLPWLTVPANPGLNDILEWCAKPKPTAASAAAYNTHCETALKRFLREIRLNLTDVRSGGGYDRHSISNVVSPLLLGGRGHSAPRDFDALSLHGSAAGRLLVACGAFAAIKEPATKPLVDARPDILLVDDQAEHGWTRWLSQVFPSVGPIKFQKTPTSLLKALKEQWGKKSSKDLRFRFQLPELQSPSTPLLFLDLRLFSGDWNAEIAFYKELLEFIKNNRGYFCEQKAAWAPIPTPTLDDIEHWLTISPKAELPQHFEAMLLFPKVLALADMALPIVLFSSTSQRDLVAPLAPYKNIFLGLNKNATQSGSAIHPHDYLASIWLQIESYAEWRGRFHALQRVKTVAKTQGISHWEIYIDESSYPEGNFFRVSGLLVGYPCGESADAINGVLTNAGIRWRYDDDAVEWIEGTTEWLGKPRNGVGDFLDKQWSSICPKLEAITKDLPILSFTVFKEFPDGLQPHDSALETPKLCDPQSLDNCFFSLLNDILEVALFEAIPSLSAAKEVTVGIYAGNRLRVFSGPSKNQQWINLHRKTYARWGVGLHLMGGSPCYQAVQMDGIVPVVSELLQKRRYHGWASALAAGIETVAGIPMNQPDNRDPDGDPLYENGVLISPPYRHLHFVADIMASLAQVGRPEITGYGAMTQSRFGFGMNDHSKGVFARRGDEDQGIGGLLRISRLLDERDRNVASAAGHFLKLDEHVNHLLELGLFARSVLIKLKSALDSELKGDHLSQLVGSTMETLAVVDNLQRERSRLERIRQAIAREKRTLQDFQHQNDNARNSYDRNVGNKRRPEVRIACESARIPRETDHVPSKDKPTETDCPQPAVANILITKTWLGPVPTGVNSKVLLKELDQKLVGWAPNNEWAGSREKGWWMVLIRKGDNTTEVPAEISLLNQQYAIVSKDPEESD